MKTTRLHDSVIGSGGCPSPAVRSERGAILSPECLDVDDNGLDWAVVDVMMRHWVQNRVQSWGMSSDNSG